MRGKLKKGKDSLWFTVSEVSAHGQRPPLLWTTVMKATMETRAQSGIESLSSGQPGSRSRACWCPCAPFSHLFIFHLSPQPMAWCHTFRESVAFQLIASGNTLPGTPIKGLCSSSRHSSLQSSRQS